MFHILLVALTALASFQPAGAQSTTLSAAGSCPTVLKPTGYSPPVVGTGYTAQLIVTGLKKPRGLIFDKDGGLLVVESGKGVTHFALTDNGGTCLIPSKTSLLIDDEELNHGIEISEDGRTLYVSSSNEVYSWAYDPVAVSVSSKTTLVTNMSNTDHTTRTLLLSRKSPGLLLVSRGSSENMDVAAGDVTSSHSQIRIFNITAPPSNPYDYVHDGMMLGWGLRNSVGVAEEPTTGGIYSVENSADQLKRQGTDIHENNPGEELNFHGVLGDSSNKYLGQNYGYPDCFALWDTSVPDLGSMTTGSQFVLDPSPSLNDSTCAATRIPPRLTFEAHMAPLDIKFTPDGSEAYITFHGSWNRDEPAGYKLSTVHFDNGEPISPSDAKDAVVDILSNADNSACPGKCFRPAGVALDGMGRVFMTSDATGDVWVLQKGEMTMSGGSGGTVTKTTTGALVAPTGSAASPTPNVAAAFVPGRSGWVYPFVAAAVAVMGGVMVVAA